MFDCFQYINEERNQSATDANVTVQLLTVAEKVGLGISGLHGVKNDEIETDWMQHRKVDKATPRLRSGPTGLNPSSKLGVTCQAAGDGCWHEAHEIKCFHDSMPSSSQKDIGT